MCETPLETRYMLAETEARARIMATVANSGRLEFDGLLARLRGLVNLFLSPGPVFGRSAMLLNGKARQDG